MDWTQVLTIVGSNIVLFLWARGESRSDIRNMDNKMDAWRNETISLINAIKEEMKDFHGRLCAIEEKNKK